MSVIIEPIKPLIGGIVRLSKERLCSDDVVETVRAALDDRGVLVFPEIAVSDEEQLAFTDLLGTRVSYTQPAPGEDASDIYKISLDREVNPLRENVEGTFFWHVDGATDVAALPKAGVMSARALSGNGGATEFANLFAAYERLTEDEKRDIADLQVIHSKEAAMRVAYGHLSDSHVERLGIHGREIERPLVWSHSDGRKSLLVGMQADRIVNRPGPEGRAVLSRLMEWSAQPEFYYRHDWRVGDMVIWNNEGLMHRVVPYSDEKRIMHRTTIAGQQRPGRLVA